MSKLWKPFKVIRENWKKTVFFTGAAIYGLNWLNEVRKAEIIRQGYCEKAKVLGDRTLSSAFQKTESVLVLVNRGAANARARSLYLKNCAPILNLAGLDIDHEDWEGNYESFDALDAIFKKANKTYSAVLVVGGNRSANAFLNYSMTRNQPVPPTAFIPVGKDSLVMTRFLPFVGSNAFVQRLCETAFKVVQGSPETVDVLRIENKEASNERPANCLYAVSTFAFDKVTDVSHKSYKYWYLPGVCKRIFVGIIGLAMGSFDERIIGEIEAVRGECPVLEEKKPEKQGSWWGSAKKKAPEAAAPAQIKFESVRSGQFDADFVAISANHPNQLGTFLVEVSKRRQSPFQAFADAVLKERPKVEDSFHASEITFSLKLIPRHAAFYIDGVPHSDFDRIVKVAIMPKAFKMFY